MIKITGTSHRVDSSCAFWNKLSILLLKFLAIFGTQTKEETFFDRKIYELYTYS